MGDSVGRGLQRPDSGHHHGVVTVMQEFDVGPSVRPTPARAVTARHPVTSGCLPAPGWTGPLSCRAGLPRRCRC
jgi:hypothetical protein